MRKTDGIYHGIAGTAAYGSRGFDYREHEIGKQQNYLRNKSDIYLQRAWQVDTNSREFADFSGKLVYGADIEHKKYGRGAVVSNDGTRLTVSFADGAREFSLKALYGQDIIKLL